MLIFSDEVIGKVEKQCNNRFREQQKGRVTTRPSLCSWSALNSTHITRNTVFFQMVTSVDV